MKNRSKKSLKREGPKRSALKKFHLFSEGKNTEPDYFKELMKTLDRKIVNIVCYGPNGVPLTVVKEAIKFMNGFRKGSALYEEKDEVWVIFDRDGHPNYTEAKNMCESKNIKYAYSDPCFELWLNLHFEDLDAPCSRHEAQAKTKTLIKDYDTRSGKTADFSNLINNIEVAENRAERQMQNRIDEGAEEGNPSTNVFKLTRNIRTTTA